MANITAYTLFDSGASCSFVAARFVRSNGIGFLEPCRVPITLPSGGIIESFWKWPEAELKVQGHVFYTELIVIELLEFDVILGMDWLS